MSLGPDQISRFLQSLHPYNALTPEMLKPLCHEITSQPMGAQDRIYQLGDRLSGLYIIYEGTVEIRDENGQVISHLGLRNSFAERGLLRDGRAATTATATSDGTLLMVPEPSLKELIKHAPSVAKFFNRGGKSVALHDEKQDLASRCVETFMTRSPVTCPPETKAQHGAVVMRDKGVSSLCITQNDRLLGIITTRDITAKLVAEGLALTTPLSQIMTPNPITLPPQAIGSDVLHVMMEKRISHVPIVEADRLIGLISKTDLTRFQAESSGEMVREIAQAQTAQEMRKVTSRIGPLLAQLVAGGRPHHVVTRLITDIADSVTRRLIVLAEQKLGAPPVPYLWLACGSQGRQEQTGVSDQDNCLILHDDVTQKDREGYFAQLSKFVCDGLDLCGYVYCPGDMMARNPMWCQPLAVWRAYFEGWIAKPLPEAQLLASVMFDLRPIAGTSDLFDTLQKETLQMASKNSIFVAHMVSNSVQHAPPLGLFGGLSVTRSGAHKNRLDMKHSGVVPIVDLGRIYALQSRLGAANTRARLEAAMGTASLSPSGGRDLLDAYDLIAQTRLEHQAKQVKLGLSADNFLAPSDLSDFDRSHLRDAFVVVKTMQSAAGHGRSVLR